MAIAALGSAAGCMHEGRGRRTEGEHSVSTQAWGGKGGRKGKHSVSTRARLCGWLHAMPCRTVLRCNIFRVPLQRVQASKPSLADVLLQRRMLRSENEGCARPRSIRLVSSPRLSRWVSALTATHPPPF